MSSPLTRARPTSMKRPAPPAPVPAPIPEIGSRRTIPFDYAFNFELKGEPDRVVKDTVTVSIEGEFVATAIGYGVSPKVSPFVFGVSVPNSGNFGDITLGQIVGSIGDASGGTVDAANVLLNGFKLNPDIADLALALEPGSNGSSPGSIAPDLFGELFRAVGAPLGEIQFKYALYDNGTGREFQSAPILNTAGLGISSGDRPFRRFATPIHFAPRTTIRMDVTEVSEFAGALQVALHGYKVLGGAGSPTDDNRPRARRPKRR